MGDEAVGAGVGRPVAGLLSKFCRCLKRVAQGVGHNMVSAGRLATSTGPAARRSWSPGPARRVRAQRATRHLRLIFSVRLGAGLPARRVYVARWSRLHCLRRLPVASFPRHYQPAESPAAPRPAPQAGRPGCWKGTPRPGVDHSLAPVLARPACPQLHRRRHSLKCLVYEIQFVHQEQLCLRVRPGGWRGGARCRGAARRAAIRLALEEAGAPVQAPLLRRHARRSTVVHATVSPGRCWSRWD